MHIYIIKDRTFITAYALQRSKKKIYFWTQNFLLKRKYNITVRNKITNYIIYLKHILLYLP